CRDASFFVSSRRRHTRSKRDWSSDVCSSDLGNENRNSRGIYWRRIKFRSSDSNFESSRCIKRTGSRSGILPFGLSRLCNSSLLRSEERRVGKGGRGEGLGADV